MSGRWSATLFARASAALDRLLDLAEPERAAELRAIAGVDPELAREVAALLAADAGSGLLDEPPTSPAADAPGRDEDATTESGGVLPFERVGPYRLLRAIGHGGMGEVYEAERADGQFAQRVALKLVRGGLATAEARARFLAERQILASLDHPGIARLLDGGAAADGRPFFALELVEGEPITAHVARLDLDIPARMGLLVQVCRAVEYAHRNLVVHRDLKPQNVLVAGGEAGAPGQVKLLDFGIAKLVGPAAGDGLTRLDRGPMTPEYAAPEQLRGASITTATDVYALGLLLCEVLAGARPFAGSAKSASELERAILERPPERLSALAKRAAGPGPAGEKLRRRLADDLDAIAFRALEKEPERRYPSVAALRDDLERHLAGLPIAAEPPRLAVRLRKFVRRHRLAAATAAISLASLLAGVAGVLWQARAARAEAAKARAVRDFVVDLVEAADPDSGIPRASDLRSLIDRGARRIGPGLARDPETSAELLGVVGELYRRLGEYDRAAPLLLRELTLRRELDEPRALVASLERVGTLALARGDLPAAEPRLREAVEVARSRFGERTIEAARAEVLLARWEALGGRGAPLVRFDRALEVLASTVGVDSADYADALDEKGGLLAARGDLPRASAAFDRVLAIRRELYAGPHTKLAESLSNAAAMRAELGDPGGAAALFREVLALDRRLWGDDHPAIAVALTNLGGALTRAGRAAEAEPILRDALARRLRASGPESPKLAVTLAALGGALAAQGRFAEAIPLYERSIVLYRKLAGPGSPIEVELRRSLAVARQGSPAVANAAAPSRILGR